MNTLLYIAALPVILIWFYIYFQDKNKESKKILSKLFLGGLSSCIIVLIVSAILKRFFPIFVVDRSSLNLIELFINVFIGVALIEEFSKWVMVYAISYDSEEFDEFYDMIVYSVAVTLGFALFENILYVFINGFKVGVIRALLAVPGHAANGIFMGYYLGLAKIAEVNGRKDLRVKNIILSILVPTLLHGFYDYCLSSNKAVLILVFFVFVIILDILSVKKVTHISKYTMPFVDRVRFCTKCGARLEVNSHYCEHCGQRVEQGNQN